VAESLLEPYIMRIVNVLMQTEALFINQRN